VIVAKRYDMVMRLALFILVPVAASIIAGAIWGVVDWLRSYGTGINPFPYFDANHYQVEPFRREQPGTLLGAIEDLNNWYNLTFRGATRFGSGLGFIFGAFVSISLFEQKPLYWRLLSGSIAGAAMGGRSALMLGSGARWSLIGYCLGALVGTLYMAFAAAPAKLKPLPEQSLPPVSTSS
jgi:hypothetical protein